MEEGGRRGGGQERGWGEEETENTGNGSLYLCEGKQAETQAKANAAAVQVPRPSGDRVPSLLELSVSFSSGLQLMNKACPHHNPQDSFKNTFTETLTVTFHHPACTTAQPSRQKSAITYAGLSHLLRSHTTENCEIFNNDVDSPYNFLKRRKTRLGR